MPRIARALAPLALVPLAGCLTLGREEATERIVEDGPISRIDVEVDAGRVELVGKADRAGASGQATSRWSDVAPEVVHYVEDGVLHVIGRCDVYAITCLVDVTIEVPTGINVGVDTGRGDVSVRNVDGDVEVTTGDGNLRMADVGGTLFVESGGGEIVGEGLGGALVDARTDDGDVTLSLNTLPTRLVARTGSGDIALVVPAGTYRVEADVPSGDLTVSPNITSDPSATSVIIAQSDNGDVGIAGRGATQAGEPRKPSAKK